MSRVDKPQDDLHLDPRPPVAAEIDDGRQKDAEAVEHAVQAVLSRGNDPGLPVLERIQGILLVHQLRRCCLANLSLSDDSKTLSLLNREEFGGFRAVGKDEWCHDSRDDRGDAVDEENPSPASPTMSTIKEADCIRDKTTKGSCPSCSREEVCYSQRDRTLVVEHGEVDQESGEETCLKHSEQQATSDERILVVAEGRESCHQTPCNGDTA